MHPDELLDALRREGAAMAATLGHGGELAGFDVPACPGWTLETLALHCGRVHRWATAVVRTQATENVPFPPKPPVVDHQWFEEGVAELVAALEEAGPEAPAWNFVGQQPAVTRFWFRRQAHETSVHRWDAQSARAGVDGADPIDTELALDGIDELLDLMLPRARAFAARQRQGEGGGDAPPELGGTVHVHATDSPHGEWLVRTAGADVLVGHGHENGDAGVRGTASDLLLWIWGRVPVDRLEVSGDPSMVARWHEVLKTP